MNYYEVLVADQSYHGHTALSYSSELVLTRGQVVMVPLRRKVVLGIVTANVAQPSFPVKPVNRVVTNLSIPSQNLELLLWLHDYYPAPQGVLVQQFLPPGLRQQPRKTTPVQEDSSSPISLPPLTSEQQAAIRTIQQEAGPTFLLHGETGTGKTRVYLELAQKQQAAGRSVLVLSPEIGLTPQLERQFHKNFRQVVVVHSQLTPAERRTAWLAILEATGPVVVIGPRSALFSPIRNLGLIVIDEAHETAYKQEQAPYYQAQRVAAQLASLHHAKLVLGSATPAITDYYLAQAKGAPILRMQELPLQGHPKTNIKVVNLREREHFTKQPHLSNELLEALRDNLHKGEQSLVFLNRRGTARLVLCQVCGWQALCPNCDLPLTYHADAHLMRCHTCGHKAPVPSSCPVCTSTDIIFKSIGTKSIVEELRREFPGARIQRFDTDNLRVDRLEWHFEAVQKGEVDILVGTQMLAKGLDLPSLSLVGVVAADTSLYFPDFTAEERTYQLLSQVVGRVGRGHRPGKAIIQTYNPEGSAIKAAISKDWASFYDQQLVERRTFLFPPFCYLLKLSCRRATTTAAQQASEKLITLLQSLKLPIAIAGPAPAFHEKNAGKYNWQIVLKSKQRAALLKAIEVLPSGWTYDLDPINLL